MENFLVFAQLCSKSRGHLRSPVCAPKAPVFAPSSKTTLFARTLGWPPFSALRFCLFDKNAWLRDDFSQTAWDNETVCRRTKLWSVGLLSSPVGQVLVLLRRRERPAPGF